MAPRGPLGRRTAEQKLVRLVSSLPREQSATKALRGPHAQQRDLYQLRVGRLRSLQAAFPSRFTKTTGVVCHDSGQHSRDGG